MFAEDIIAQFMITYSEVSMDYLRGILY